MTIKLTRLDLDFILTQIQMAEAGQVPVNPLLSFGLREVDGTNNNLTAGGSNFGSSFQPFPTLTDSAVPERAVRHVLFADERPGHRFAAAHDQPADRQPEHQDHAAQARTALSAPRTTS